MFLADLTRVFGTTLVVVTIAAATIGFTGGYNTPSVSDECQTNIPLVGQVFGPVCDALK